MKLKYLAYVIAALSAGTLTACGSDDSSSSSNNNSQVADKDSDTIADASDNCPDTANQDQKDSDANGKGDACDALPTQYTFTSQFDGFEGNSTVSYSGQTARQVMIADLTSAVKALTEDNSKTADDVKSNLMFYVSGDVDGANYNYSVDGQTVSPGPTYGDISTGKNLSGKIAGGNGTGGGETGTLLSGGFFGWEEGMDESPLPIELLENYITDVATLATDGVSVSIDTASGSVNVDDVTVDQYGRDYDQLIQKFALGAVAFSQGTADYLKTDFANSNAQTEGKAYSTSEHKWDEAFGYFGAARDYNDYTDLEIRAKSGRPEYASGYHDTDGDGLIDLRAEINLANSTNCAKRDVGSADNTAATDFTKEAFDAFLLGRRILNNAAGGTLTDAQQTILDEQIETAAVTWEKCVAATVVYYINDVTGDMDNFTAENKFANASNFTDLAKHWSEMKGFALGLQFSPYSPFRSGKVADIDVDDLKEVLSLMGDAPVLADGTQMGAAFSGGVDQYKADLLKARDILQKAYEFDETNTANW
ncbi:MAG: DUF4856 domain-containing protein [Oceanospirillaceae bacterium]|nr:DUF4856 domain-containing protein [Oceanospirillaceae bacterium]